MGFLRRVFGFLLHPSHSRTLGLVIMLILVAAVSLTVYVAQQQQETRQRADDNAYNRCFTDITNTYNACQAGCNSDNYPQDCIKRNCVPAYQSGNIYCVGLLSITSTPTPTPLAEAGKPYTIGLIGDKCPEGTKYATPVIFPQGYSGSICCAFETPVFCSMDDYRCVASKSECKIPTSTNVVFSPTNTPTPAQTACEIAGGSCIESYPGNCFSPSVITPSVSCGSDRNLICCINPASIYCGGDNSKCPTAGYTCDTDGYCSPKQIAVVLPTPTPTPIPTRPQCPAPNISVTDITQNDFLTRVLGANNKFKYKFIIIKADSSELVTTSFLSGSSGNSGGTVLKTLTPGTKYTVFVNVSESDITADCQAPGISSSQSVTTLSSNPTPNPTSTPTPVPPTATPVPSIACIKLTDVNSLARLYIQGKSNVRLQDVNIKARQYKQNPCP